MSLILCFFTVSLILFFFTVSLILFWVFFKVNLILCYFVYSEPDSILDVEGDDGSINKQPPYDQAKARSAMNECDRHVALTRPQQIGDDWEERVVK